MRTLGRLAPPLVLMGITFALSAQSDLSTGLGVWDLIGRKLVHMSEYALLWLLWLRALHWRRPGVAAAIAIAYACTDELHQHFVNGRVGSPIDVAIDATGVALAWLAWRTVWPRWRAARMRSSEAGMTDSESACPRGRG